ncbi:MAG: nucleoside deaminase [Candidatus Omnitrophica bacterium]|nr:nucleoside deaminase [Candidatus Omnitrophota bacterium]
MTIALSAAKKGCQNGYGGPFGCCIVKKDKIIARASNTVLKSSNPTAHAEINTIVKACAILKTHVLDECVIYTTTEPCPMCFSAIHWAKIPIIVYGTAIEDVKKLGFNELMIKAKQLKISGKSSVKIIGGFMLKECEDLLDFWKNLPGQETY